jgi:hypothetical protein
VVSTERSLLICASCMHTHPHACKACLTNYHSPTSFGVSRLVHAVVHMICAPLIISNKDLGYPSVKHVFIASNHVLIFIAHQHNLLRTFVTFIYICATSQNIYVKKKNNNDKRPTLVNVSVDKYASVYSQLHAHRARMEIIS